MPPKAKITKEMILHTVLDITRETGFETVNARSIAGKLQCSTRPIFTCYKSMDEVKKEFLDFAFDFYNEYASNYARSANKNLYLTLPLSYIAFAEEETNLFKLLFVSDMDLNMTEEKDFYKDPENERKAKIFSETIGMDLENAKTIFLDLFFYSHGIAVLTAAKKISLSRENTEKMILNMLTVLVRQKKPDWDMTN